MKRKKITSLTLNKKKIASFTMLNEIKGKSAEQCNTYDSRLICPEPDTEGTCAPTADTLCQSFFPLCE